MEHMYILFGALMLFVQTTALQINQDKYKIYIDRVEFYNYDTKFVKLDIQIFKYSRTLNAVNVSFEFLQDVPFNPNEEIEFQTYEFLNNEYKPFAIHSRKPICTFLTTTYPFLFQKDCGPEFIPAKCPVKKGIYRVYNYNPSTASFPNMPFHKVRLDIRFYGNKNLTNELKAYARFDRDIIYREQFD